MLVLAIKAVPIHRRANRRATQSCQLCQLGLPSGAWTVLFWLEPRSPAHWFQAASGFRARRPAELSIKDYRASNHAPEVNGKITFTSSTTSRSQVGSFVGILPPCLRSSISERSWSSLCRRTVTAERSFAFCHWGGRIHSHGNGRGVGIRSDGHERCH